MNLSNTSRLLPFYFLAQVQATNFWSNILKSTHCLPLLYSGFCEKQLASELHLRPPPPFSPIRFLNQMMSECQRVVQELREAIKNPQPLCLGPSAMSEDLSILPDCRLHVMRLRQLQKCCVPQILYLCMLRWTLTLAALTYSRMGSHVFVWYTSQHTGWSMLATQKCPGSFCH